MRSKLCITLVFFTTLAIISGSPVPLGPIASILSSAKSVLQDQVHSMLGIAQRVGLLPSPTEAPQKSINDKIDEIHLAIVKQHSKQINDTYEYDYKQDDHNEESKPTVNLPRVQINSARSRSMEGLQPEASLALVDQERDKVVIQSADDRAAGLVSPADSRHSLLHSIQQNIEDLVPQWKATIRPVIRSKTRIDTVIENDAKKTAGFVSSSVKVSDTEVLLPTTLSPVLLGSNLHLSLAELKGKGGQALETAVLSVVRNQEKLADRVVVKQPSYTEELSITASPDEEHLKLSLPADEAKGNGGQVIIDALKTAVISAELSKERIADRVVVKQPSYTEELPIRASPDEEHLKLSLPADEALGIDALKTAVISAELSKERIADRVVVQQPSYTEELSIRAPLDVANSKPTLSGKGQNVDGVLGTAERSAIQAEVAKKEGVIIPPNIVKMIIQAFLDVENSKQRLAVDEATSKEGQVSVSVVQAEPTEQAVNQDEDLSTPSDTKGVEQTFIAVPTTQASAKPTVKPSPNIAFAS